LVVATQGRSFWILDDVTPLHQLNDRVAGSDAFLFKPRDTYRIMGGPSRRSGNTNTFRDRLNGGGVDWDQVGDDGPVGAVIYYYLADAAGEVRLEILERSGSVIQSFTNTAEREQGRISADPGMNRFVWDLRYPDAEVIDNTLFRGTSRGPQAVPGTYRVRLVAGGTSQTKSFQVVKDPRVPSSQADLREQFNLLIEIRDAISETYDAIKSIRRLRAQVTEAAEVADEEVRQAGEALASRLSEVEHGLIEPRIQYREDCWNFPSKLNHFLAYLAEKVGTGDYRPTDAARERYRELRDMLDEQLIRLMEVLGTDLAGYNGMLRERNLPTIGPIP
jgi:hypothetical protein